MVFQLSNVCGDAFCNAHRGMYVIRMFHISRSRSLNSIAFGSAPQREADSQPIGQLVKQAVSQTVSRASRQADRNT